MREIRNPKARRKYFIADKYEAGVALKGTEVKSVRDGKVQLGQAFAKFVKDELFLFNAHVSEYEFGGLENHEPRRPRKLLLHRRELNRLKIEVEAGGKAIVPLRIYFKGALVKVQLGVGTGKKLQDKREDLKKRSAQREAEQALKRSRHR
ncbi:MAG: SsrA-binding protein [Opitutales bacterium]|nr:SsrA-binding protein [Opitutales bacterium]|tara:strand:+ start:191 stop:640 length:450 start_codon:yes stop_codon:yes gene_type:complete